MCRKNCWQKKERRRIIIRIIRIIIRNGANTMSPKLRLGDIIRKQTVLYFVTFLKHSIKLGILHKMKTYAITGNSINWFNSYLKSRKQQVVLK